MLDGGDVLNWWQRNAGGNVTGASLGIEAIAEFRTLTNTYSAEYGGNGGAITAGTSSAPASAVPSIKNKLRNFECAAGRV